MEGGIIGEIVLAPEELRRLETMDSRMFGFVNLQAPEAFRDRVMVQKAVKIYEKQLLDQMNKDSSASEEKPREDARLFLKLAHLHLLCHDFAKALSAYQRVFALEKDGWRDPVFFYGLGMVYFHFRAFEFASEAFRQVLYAAPCFQRTNEIHLRLGHIYEALEDWELALKHFNCALIDSSPECSLSKCEIRFRIAHCYDQRGDLKKAKDLYEAILNDQQPLNDRVKAAIYRQLGWIFYRADFLPEDRTQRLQAAVGWLSESLKLDSNSGNTYYYLGRCFSAIPGRAHDAFVNYRFSIDKSEASADTWCSIGVLYQQQQQPMDALQAFVCAVQLDGRHSAAWTDLGLLYESTGQFQDAYNCYKKASKYKPANPESLRARIDLLERELKKQPPKQGVKPDPNKLVLPSLEEAWRLPIPAELTQRQEGFLKQKQERYIQGSPLLAMGALSAELESAAGPEAKGPLPPFYLNDQQIQMMHVLQQNQGQLDSGQIEVLKSYQNSFSLMQQHMKFVQQQKNMAKQAGQSSSQGAGPGELPQIAQEDLLSVLGTSQKDILVDQKPPANMETQTSSRNTDDFLLGESSDEGTKDGLLMSGEDPMLNQTKAQGVNGQESTVGTPAPVAQSVSTESERATGLQDTRITSSSEQPDGSKMTSSGAAMGNLRINASFVPAGMHSSGQALPPPPMNLTAAVYIPTSTCGTEVLQMASQRSRNPGTYKPVFEEHCPPPAPPPAPAEKLPKEKLQMATPSVIVDSKKDAFAPELQNFCYKQSIVLIKGMTAALKMDLGLFSTKTLVETAPDHQVEIRTQPKMEPDKNTDQFGEPTWRFDSTRSFTTVAKYAQYQAQSFQQSLREEQERIKSGGPASGKSGNSDFEQPSGKRGKKDQQTQPEEKTYKILKFGTNVDLSDERKWKVQLQELIKLPPFMRIMAGCNMLTHLGHTVLGMNTVQLYMKIPGSRTPGHQENNNFPALNINIGPGETEWFAVPTEYWGEVCRLVEKRKINFLTGSWWPCASDLWELDIPCCRFVQKPGDVVWVGSGCVHWVQATGWCNNIAWNVGPITALTVEMACERYEWNKLMSYKSIVPMQHLFWQLARNIRFTNAELFQLIKRALIRSLGYIQMSRDFVEGCEKQIKHHPRTKNEVAHYCAICDVEVFNVLFVLEQHGKYVVHCVDCSRRIDPHLNNFTVLQQWTTEELISTFDACTLNPKRPGIIC